MSSADASRPVLNVSFRPVEAIPSLLLLIYSLFIHPYLILSLPGSFTPCFSPLPCFSSAVFPISSSPPSLASLRNLLPERPIFSQRHRYVAGRRVTLQAVVSWETKLGDLPPPWGRGNNFVEPSTSLERPLLFGLVRLRESTLIESTGRVGSFLVFGASSETCRCSADEGEEITSRLSS